MGQTIKINLNMNNKMPQMMKMNNLMIIMMKKETIIEIVKHHKIKAKLK
jgi:hypothetical protein